MGEVFVAKQLAPIRRHASSDTAVLAGAGRPLQVLPE